MRKYISLIIFTTFLTLTLTGCAAAEPATKTVEKVAEVEATKEAPSPKPVEKKTPDYAKESKKIQKQLNVIFDCEWDNLNTLDDSIVHADACTSSGIIVATGQESAVNVWLDNMGEEGTAYAVHGEDWAVFSPDEGTRNQAWDALGAEGETETIG